jgi:hypothetical protein
MNEYRLVRMRSDELTGEADRARLASASASRPGPAAWLVAAAAGGWHRLAAARASRANTRRWPVAGRGAVERSSQWS